MNKKPAFATLLIFCTYLLYSCNGGGSATETKSDSNTVVAKTDSTSVIVQKKKKNRRPSIADSLVSFADANFTGEDSAKYFVSAPTSRLAPFESDVHPLIISGRDFNDIYQNIKDEDDDSIDDDDLIYIYFRFTGVHKSPFGIFAESVSYDRKQRNRVLSKPAHATVNITSDVAGPPPRGQGWWVRPALIRKASIDTFITNLQNDSPSIDFKKDFAKYQVVIMPKLMAEAQTGRPNQYIGLFLTIEPIDQKDPLPGIPRTEASKVKQSTNPCPVCKQ